MITEVIEDIARYAIASLFYFELDFVPKRYEDVHVETSHILCLLRESDSNFKAFINRLSSNSTYFYLNNSPIASVVGDDSFLGVDGNFRKRV